MTEASCRGRQSWTFFRGSGLNWAVEMPSRAVEMGWLVGDGLFDGRQADVPLTAGKRERQPRTAWRR